MADLYENLRKATNNIDDITTEKYGVITKLEGTYCSIKETDNGLEHNNVPILNGLNLAVGSKVVLGFVENNIYDCFVIGSVGSKDLYTKAEVDNLIIGGVDIVTSWQSTPSDSNVPSEKLVKNSLPTKVSELTNDSGFITSSAISGMLTSSDIADNLTTNDSTKVLSAKQGKALKDLIGAAITYINQ